MKLKKLKQHIPWRYINSLFIFYISGVSGGFIQAQNNQHRVVLLVSTELNILGKTNINSFRCNLVQTNLNDTLATMVNPTTDNACNFEGLEILFSVADFICDLALMTNDLRQLLNEKAYPFIRMQIEEVDLNSIRSSQMEEAATASIYLSMAGVRRYEQITDAKIEENNDKLTFTGTYQLHLTDFKITPPTKLLGMVRTKDLVKIDFTIVLKLQ